MKFIHSGDWHLGLRLRSYDLSDTQFAQVERILNLCEQHQADVLVVAGDVFEKRTNLATLTRRLTELLKPHIERGLSVILMSGNHDTFDHLGMMRALLHLEGAASSLLRVVEQPEFFEMCGVQWGAVPYPDRDALARWARESASDDDRDGAINRGYARRVAEIASHFDGSKPAVFIGHVTVAGVKTPSDMEIAYAPGLRIGREDLPANCDYIALGHIHQPQRIGNENSVPAYYCGDLDRYNRGERHDPQKGVYLVELETGAPATATWLPLPVTPFHEITVRVEEVEALPARYGDLERAFVNLTLDCQGASAGDITKARQRVHELCRRLLDCTQTGDSTDVAAPTHFVPSDWRATARDYVNERFAGRADLKELQLKTGELLEEVENAIKSR